MTTTVYIATITDSIDRVTIDTPPRETIDEARADAMQSLHDLSACSPLAHTARVVEYDRDEDGDLHHRRVVETIDR